MKLPMLRSIKKNIRMKISLILGVFTVRDAFSFTLLDTVNM